MRLLLDINIILDVLLQRPGEVASTKLIATCGQNNQVWLAWHSVATLAYLVERQKDSATARNLITDLLSWAQVATTGHDDALPDFERCRVDMREFSSALPSAPTHQEYARPS